MYVSSLSEPGSDECLRMPFGHDVAGLHRKIGMPMFMEGTGDSMGKPTRWFLLASITDSIATTPARIC